MYYRVVESINHLELTEEVNRFYKNGWVAQGGISITEYGARLRYAQAMVKGKTK